MEWWQDVGSYQGTRKSNEIERHKYFQNNVSVCRPNDGEVAIAKETLIHFQPNHRTGSYKRMSLPVENVNRMF